MTHPTPQGTRDILPDEMRELRRIESTLRELFESRGYGEVSTPAIEYDEVLRQGDERMARAAYRFFDPSGELLALRSDMTIPIARMVADRFADAEPPFRLHYIDTAYRAVRAGREQLREFRQAGIELFGADAPGGTAEVIEVLVASLDAVGLERAIVGLGDADLFRQTLAELGVEGVARDRILDRLAAHDLVAIEAEAGDLAGLSDPSRELIVELSSLRGGAEVLARAGELGGEAVRSAAARLTATYELLERAGVADRVQIDFGLLRDLGYYTGAIDGIWGPRTDAALRSYAADAGLSARLGNYSGAVSVLDSLAV